MGKKNIAEDGLNIETVLDNGEGLTQSPEATVSDASDEAKTEGKSELEALRDEYESLNGRYMRLLAEYDNFRKRTQKEKDDIYPSAAAAALMKFLPILDNLERASAFEKSTDEFAKGFDMICQSFKDALTAMGVEAIGEEGEQFDPAYHNAAMHIEDEKLGANVVSQVFQKGYKLGDKVIRYAMVQTAN